MKNTSYLSSGDTFVTYTHKDDGSTRIFAKVSEKNATLELFKYYSAFDSKPNQCNTFVYMPSPSSKIAVVIEFGVRKNGASFSEPDRKTLCIGSENRTSSNKAIKSQDSYASREKTVQIIPSEEVFSNIPEWMQKGIQEVSNAQKWDDLSPPIQDYIRKQFSDFPEFSDSKLFEMAKNKINEQFRNPSPATLTRTMHSGISITTDFSEKHKMDDFHREQRENTTASSYSYERVILVAPEGEEASIISEEELEGLKTELKTQMNLLESAL